MVLIRNHMTAAVVNLRLDRYNPSMSDAADLIERLTLLVRSDARHHEQGLAPVQYATLAYLARSNRYSNTLTALTAYLGATKGTVSETLRSLLERDLIDKAMDEGDKRVTRLSLTEAGRILSRSFERRGWQSVVAALPKATQRRLAAELRGLLLALQQRNGGRSFGVCATCQHFRRETDGFRCGLTEERLSKADSLKICYEHERA
ncbi:MAG: winged helix-turn-helix transcriptional regulator [Deltaproteobacteria bacterium]|nr:winged helix-turn-helix transcriptional regulator [Deltaproteobacteria bacterium]